MKIDTYLIQYDGELYAHPRRINPRGFTYDEAECCIENMQWKGAMLI